MIDVIAVHVSLHEYKVARASDFFQVKTNLDFNVKFSDFSVLATNSNKKEQSTHMCTHIPLV